MPAWRSCVTDGETSHFLKNILTDFKSVIYLNSNGLVLALPSKQFAHNWIDVGSTPTWPTIVLFSLRLRVIQNTVGPPSRISCGCESHQSLHCTIDIVAVCQPSKLNRSVRSRHGAPVNVKESVDNKTFSDIVINVNGRYNCSTTSNVEDGSKR